MCDKINILSNKIEDKDNYSADEIKKFNEERTILRIQVNRNNLIKSDFPTIIQAMQKNTEASKAEHKKPYNARYAEYRARVAKYNARCDDRDVRLSEYYARERRGELTDKEKYELTEKFGKEKVELDKESDEIDKEKYGLDWEKEEEEKQEEEKEEELEELEVNF